MKKEKVMEYLKKYRLFLPFGIYLILQFLALGVGKLTNSTLRSIPKLFLFWMAVITSMLLLLGISREVFKWGCRKGLKGFPMIKAIWYGEVTTPYFGETANEPVRIAENVVSMDCSTNGYFCIYLTKNGELYGMGAIILGLLGG